MSACTKMLSHQQKLAQWHGSELFFASNFFKSAAELWLITHIDLITLTAQMHTHKVIKRF